MSKAKMTLEEQITNISNIANDVRYTEKHARSPKSKRANKMAVVLFESILDSLNKLKKLR